MNTKAEVKVYRLRYGEGYEWLLPVDSADFERLKFTGAPLADSWIPVKMKRLRVWEDGRKLKAGDFYACSGGNMLIFGDRAKQTLGTDLAKYGEILPLTCEAVPYWTLNVMKFIDALDESASELVRFRDGGIMRIKRYAMKRRAVEGAGLFKLPQEPRGLIYAGDEFVAKLKQTDLVGLEPKQIWPPPSN